MLVTKIIIQNDIAGKSQAAAQGGLGGQEGDKCCSYKSDGMQILVLFKWYDVSFIYHLAIYIVSDKS